MPNPLTPATGDLSRIFWEIRQCRVPNLRRSWMRRARLALAANHRLTDAQRHEVMCVWSRRECSQIFSEALGLVTGNAPSRAFCHLRAKRYLRARFMPDGQAISRLGNRFKVGKAANDDFYDVPLYACGQAALF
jgi:hypothetical protein